MNIIVRLIRIALTILLCWGVYRETGPCTALSLLLMAFAFEYLLAYTRTANKLAGVWLKSKRGG